MIIKHEEKKKKFQLKRHIEGGVFGRGKLFLRPSSIHHDSSLPQISKAGSIRMFLWPVEICFLQICIPHHLLRHRCNNPVFDQCCLHTSLHFAIYSVLPPHPMPSHSTCNSLPHSSLPFATPPVTQVSPAFSHIFYGLRNTPSPSYIYLLLCPICRARASMCSCLQLPNSCWS